MAKTIGSCIYILTNPQYPGYVKIGYTSDLKQRVSSLNTSALSEFSPYAVYETSLQNADKEVHAIISLLNPILRASKYEKGKTKDKEFFKLEPEEAFDLLQRIAKVSGTSRKVYRVSQNFEPITDEGTQVTNRVKIYSPKEVMNTETTEASVLHKGKPTTIHFIRSSNDESDYRPFRTWADYSIQVISKAIKEYGVQTVKNRVLDKNMKKFHTPKRDAFADNKEAMRDFSCKEVVDGLWFLTNYSSKGHLAIIHELEALFPRVKSELIYA